MHFRQSYSEMISLDVKIKRNKDRHLNRCKNRKLRVEIIKLSIHIRYYEFVKREF